MNVVDTLVEITITTRSIASQTRKTQTEKQSLNPSYEEIFHFKVSAEELASAAIRFDVIHDRSPVEYLTIGYVIIEGSPSIGSDIKQPLFLHSLKSSEITKAWFSLTR